MIIFTQHEKLVYSVFFFFQGKVSSVSPGTDKCKCLRLEVKQTWN